MTDEERARVEEIRARQFKYGYSDLIEAEADVAWLLGLVERQEAAARWMGERMLRGVGSRDTGISSDAMVAAVVLGRDVPERSYPHDTGDLGRCWRAADAAPPHLKERAEAILKVFEEHVSQRAVR